MKSPSTSSMNIPTSQSSVSQVAPASSQSNPCTPTVSTLTSSTFLLNNPFFKNHSTSRTATSPLASASSSSMLKSKSSQASLEKYFDKCQMPLNRILYNLEALSGRLMPPHSLSSSDHSKVDTFQQDFLQANGLNVLTSLLKLDSFGKIDITSDEYETKQDIYLLLLQLLHLLIFGSYYPFNHAQIHSSHNKRPSSEPISCCSSAPKKAVTQSMMDDHLLCNSSQQQNSLPPVLTPTNLSCNSPQTSLNATFALGKFLNFILALFKPEQYKKCTKTLHSVFNVLFFVYFKK